MARINLKHCVLLLLAFILNLQRSQAEDEECNLDCGLLGFQMVDGERLCDCNLNPCDEMMCAVDERCVLQRVICPDGPCPPKGVCKKGTDDNICPNGKPLTNPWTGLNIICNRPADCPKNYECLFSPGERKTACCPLAGATPPVMPGITFPSPATTRRTTTRSTWRTTPMTVPETTSAVPVEKPGFCPKPGAPGSSGTCVVECTPGNDNTCQDDRKCCYNGCGYTCASPAPATPPPPKTGTCPAPERHLRSCNVAVGEASVCKSDASCPGDQKCCFDGCVHVCRSPTENTKPGRCPALIMGGLCSTQCTTDRDCGPQNDFKCCSHSCGTICVPPESPSTTMMTMTTTMSTTTPGFCPATPEVRLCLWSACSTDADCGFGQKCCNDGCGGAACMRSMPTPPQPTTPTTKPGVCPPPPDFPPFCDKIDCVHDGECGGDAKCCAAGCGSVLCTSPFVSTTPLPTTTMTTTTSPLDFDRPGFCPSEPETQLCHWRSCHSDVACPAGMKCCEDGCGGAACMTAKSFPPTSPTFSTQPPTQPPTQPTYPRFKDGVCPYPSQPMICDFMECHNDFDCAGDEKCCYAGCGSHKCVGPVIFASTTPSTSPSPSFCPATPDFKFCAWNLCESDAECDAGKKCCSDGCGALVCSKAVTTPQPTTALPPKPGSCPTHGAAAVCNVKECGVDTDCFGDNKCCDVGCGASKCLAPETGSNRPKRGTCPNPVPSSFPIVCNLDQCGGDKDCPGSQKCCASNCNSRLCMPTHDDIYGSAMTTTMTTTSSFVNKEGSCGAELYINCNMVGCLNDGSCPGNQKCCSTGCGGYHCIVPQGMPQPVIPTATPSLATSLAPPYSRPGVCPVPNSLGPCHFQCSVDEDCPWRQKCCSNGCGQMCVNPYEASGTLKSGSCPAPVRTVMCTQIPSEICSEDAACEGDKKCCVLHRGCKPICVNPIEAINEPSTPPPPTRPSTTLAPPTSSDPGSLIKFGTCPSKWLTGPCPMDHRCTTDRACPGLDRCCNSGCGMICTLPVEFTTSAPSGPTNRPLTSGATSPLGPTPSAWMPGAKAGRCPTFVDDAVCIYACNDDTHCPLDHKCCFNGCGQICVSPARDGSSPTNAYTTASPVTPVWTRRPRKCPTVMAGVECADGPLVTCTGDADCGGEFRCCFDGCGYSCRAEGDSVISSGGASHGWNHNNNNNGGWDMHNNGGTINGVIAPDNLISKPGICPAVALNAGVCRRCSSDGDCDGPEKCCTDCCRKPQWIRTTTTSRDINQVKTSPTPLDVKRGRCPKTGSVGCVQRSCSNDADCYGATKCCDGCCKVPLPDPHLARLHLGANVTGGSELADGDDDDDDDERCKLNCGSLGRKATCDCNEDPCLKTDCPLETQCVPELDNCHTAHCLPQAKCIKKDSVCQLDCGDLGRITEDGELKCRCAENPCRTYACPSGQICSLEKVICITAPCPPQPVCRNREERSKKVVCDIYCPWGFLEDDAGEPTCECKSNPCASVACASGQRCVVKRVECMKEPCVRQAVCESISDVKIKSRCRLAPDAGPCEAAKPMWYFDGASKRCRQFIYGGCQGNENRFGNYVDCLRECGGSSRAAAALTLRHR